VRDTLMTAPDSAPIRQMLAAWEPYRPAA